MDGRFHSPAFLLPAERNPILLPAMVKKECEWVVNWVLTAANPTQAFPPVLRSLFPSYSKTEMKSGDRTPEFSS